MTLKAIGDFFCNQYSYMERKEIQKAVLGTAAVTVVALLVLFPLAPTSVAVCGTIGLGGFAWIVLTKKSPKKPPQEEENPDLMSLVTQYALKLFLSWRESNG